MVYLLTKIPPALRCEDSSHHPSTNFGGCKLGRDNSTQRIVPANTNTHLPSRHFSAIIITKKEETDEEAPRNQYSNDVDGGGGPRYSLAEGSNNYDQQFNTI